MKNNKLLRISQVMEKAGIARSTIWLWVKEGKFPSPIKLSPRVTVWKKSELDAWIESQEK